MADRMQHLTDRTDAGRRLAERFALAPPPDPVVVALPRGGVPVGWEIARRLGAPLRVLLVRKIGSPGNPELAAGALVGVDEPNVVLNHDVVKGLNISSLWLEREIARQRAENVRRAAFYGDVAHDPAVKGRSVILVDDGIATGATFRAAVRALRRRAPDRLIAAVPVAPASTIRELSHEVDEVVCLFQPPNFGSVGAFYDEFSQVDDEEVIRLVSQAAVSPGPEAGGDVGSS